MELAGKIREMPGGQRENGEGQISARRSSYRLLPIAVLAVALITGLTQEGASAADEGPVVAPAGLAADRHARDVRPSLRVGWPNFHIRYKVMNPKIARYARWGARVWNKANVRYKFVRVTKKSDAQVLIFDSRSCEDGEANMGFSGDDLKTKASISGCGSRSASQRVATHELGHVLGLGHPRKCGVMSYYCNKLVRRPTAREKRQVRRMARARDRAVRQAPKSPELRILEIGGIEGDGEYEETSVNLKLSLAASLDQLTWNDLGVYVEPILEETDPDYGLNRDPNECDLDLFDFNDTYGPWGLLNTWTATRWVWCQFDGAPGDYRVTVRATSGKGLVLTAQDEFTVNPESD